MSSAETTRHACIFHVSTELLKRKIVRVILLPYNLNYVTQLIIMKVMRLILIMKQLKRCC